MKRFAFLFLLMMLALLVIPASAQEMPAFSDLAPGEWTQLELPGGVCLYGEDYSFFVRPDDTPTDNLLVYFQGGGACWDGLTCGSIGQFASFYEVTEETIAYYASGVGIFDFDSPANPLADYNVVFLPYCTGDVHSGDSDYTFDVPDIVEADFDTIDVYFKGHHNTQLVLDWVYENFAEPEQIVVSGCSAGGYGAVSQAPYIMEHYAGIPAVMIADSSHGARVPEWNGLATWGTVDNLPAFMTDMADITLENYDTSLHVELSAEYFSDNQFAQFNSYLDGVQIGFFGTLQGYDLSFDNEVAEVASQWSGILFGNILSLSQLDNFKYYTAGGTQHCLVNSDLFYAYDQSGVIFADWFAGVISGAADNVSCSVLAQDCFVSPLEE